MAACNQLVDVGQRLISVAQRRTCGRLCQHRQVVGQAHQLHGLHEGGISDEIAQPHAGKIESLRHRARDHQRSREFSNQRGRRRASGKLRVGLINNHDPIDRMHGVAQLLDLVQSGRRASGVIRRSDKQHRRLMFSDGSQRGVDVDGEIYAPRDVEKFCVRASRQNRMHGVRRLEAQHAAARATKCLQ